MVFPFMFDSCSKDMVTLYSVNNQRLFLSVENGEFLPHLKLVHQCKLMSPNDRS
jgi:hypothetical protein